MALDSGQNICINIDKISVVIVTHHFLQFLGLLYIIFCAFVIELWPMTDVFRLEFQFRSISSEEMDRI